MTKYAACCSVTLHIVWFWVNKTLLGAIRVNYADHTVKTFA